MPICSKTSPFASVAFLRRAGKQVVVDRSFFWILSCWKVEDLYPTSPSWSLKKKQQWHNYYRKRWQKWWSLLKVVCFLWYEVQCIQLISCMFSILLFSQQKISLPCSREVVFSVWTISLFELCSALLAFPKEVAVIVAFIIHKGICLSVCSCQNLCEKWGQRRQRPHSITLQPAALMVNQGNLPEFAPALHPQQQQ